MPFGVVFASIVYVILGPWVGIRLLSMRTGPAIAGGSLLILFGITLGIALLSRLRWARWVGVVVGVLLGMLGAFLVNLRGSVPDVVVFFASFAAALLLLLPASGNASRPGADGSNQAPRRARVLGWTCAITLLGLVATGAWAIVDTGLLSSTSIPIRASAAKAPRTAAPKTVAPRTVAHDLDWLDYGEGIERAKSERKAVLVDFYATWCQPCKAMERRTFRDRAVVGRLAGLVTVRVNSEEGTIRDGYRGAELAERFDVRVYPTIVLLDPEGREIARHAGAAGPGDFLAWLDGSLREVSKLVASSP